MKVRAGLGCLGFIAIAIGGYIAAHKREPAPPLWTEVDVPRPAHDDNGWSEIARHRIDPIPDEHLEMLQRLDVWPDSWETTDAQVATLEPNLIESSEALREAIARQPRFFDGCPLHFDTACSLVETLGLWQHYQIAILLDGDTELAADVWRRASDFATTCRTVVGCILGLQLLKRTLRVVRWLVHRQVEGLDTLRNALGELDLPDAQFQRAVIGDYIEKHALFLTDEQPLLADRAQTLRFLARDYEEIHAYAANDGTPRPRGRRYSEGMFAWLYNAEGKHLLDMLETTSMICDYTERYWQEANELMLARQELLERMN